MCGCSDNDTCMRISCMCACHDPSAWLRAMMEMRDTQKRQAAPKLHDSNVIVLPPEAYS